MMQRVRILLFLLIYLACARWAGAEEPQFPAPDHMETVSYEDATLQTVIEDLGKRFDVTLVLDGRSFADDGVSLQDKITFAEQRLTLSAALDALLHRRSLGWQPKSQFSFRERGYITIRADVTHCPVYTARVYKLTGKLAGEELIDKIEREVAPQSWHKSGLGEGQILCAEKSFAVVYADDEVHHQLALKMPELLAPALGESVYPPDGVEAKLRALHSFAWQEKPFNEAMSELQRASGLKIDYDDVPLFEKGINLRTRLVLNSRRLPTASILSLATRQIGAGYAVHDDRIVIGLPKDDDEPLLFKREYDVRDLLRHMTDDTLLELITSAVTPNSWREAGGALDDAMFVRPGWLLVNHSAAGHRELAQFLADIRAAVK